MTVYVDKPRYPVGRMLMGHMVALDLAELHAMADRIGVARRWYQDPLTMPVSRPHYDISTGAHREAIRQGAVLVDRYQMSVVSTLALHRLLGIDRDPLALFRRREHPRLSSLEAWLAEQVAA